MAATWAAKRVDAGFKPAPTARDRMYCLVWGCRPPLARFLATFALLLTVALAVGCRGNSATATPAVEAGGQVRGLVVEVVGRNIAEVETIRVRDDFGKVWDFAGAEGNIGITPSHLREHQLTGQAVLVTYVMRGGTLVAVDVAD